MKRFKFELETVLGYKQQVLDGIKSEYATLMDRVRKQEIRLNQTTQEHRNLNAEFRKAETEGMSIASARSYEIGLRVLETRIRTETEVLNQYIADAELKREEMVLAKQESATLEKLRENNLKSYRKDAQRQEELFIDELVAAARVAAD